MTAVHATIARHPVELDRTQVERAMRQIAPEPIQAHYVVIERRRFPPKQVIATVTGLDRSTFITTQARSILERLGFTVGRLGGSTPTAATSEPPRSTADERLQAEADLLRPYIGEFVAVDPDWTEIIASGPDPRSVGRALRAVGRAGTIFKVPADAETDIGGSRW